MATRLLLLRGEEGLGDAGPHGVADVDVVVADHALVLVLITAGNGVTPEGVSDPPAVAALSLLAGVGSVEPEEGGEASADREELGLLLDPVLGGEGEVTIALEAGVNHVGR